MDNTAHTHPRSLVAAACAAVAWLALAPAHAQPSPPAPPSPQDHPPIEAKAVDTLSAACKALAAAKAMSFTAVNTYEKAAWFKSG